MPVMVGAKRRQEEVRSVVVNLETYIIETVDLTPNSADNTSDGDTRVIGGVSGGMGLR